MYKRLFLILLISCFAQSLWAQKALKAFKQLGDGDLSKALATVEKGLDKAPNDPANFFVLAKLYSFEGFREELIDSAHYYVLLADSGFVRLSDKLKSRYERKGMDSIKMHHLHDVIDSLAFLQSKLINTEKSFNHYLSLYNDAKFIAAAKEFRNEVAYQSALAQRTPEALSSFFKLYPDDSYKNQDKYHLLHCRNSGSYS